MSPNKRAPYRLLCSCAGLPAAVAWGWEATLADLRQVGTGLGRAIRKRYKHALAFAGAVGTVVVLALVIGASRPEPNEIVASAAPQLTAPEAAGTAPVATAFPMLAAAATPTAARAEVASGTLVPALTPTPPLAGEAASRRPAEAITHVVREGETLSEIAEAYGISPDSIKWANAGVDDPNFLRVGQTLVVPPISGILHTVLEGDTLLDVATLYDVEVEEIAEANALAEPYMLAIGQLLVVPGGKPPAPAEPATQLMAMVAPLHAETSARGGREAMPTPTPAPAATPAPPVVRIAGLSEANAAFIAKLVGPAQRSMRETGVPASVTIAQAIWEADWGRSGLAIKANNYFGIKGRPKPGPAGVIWLDTWEHVNGRNITVKEPFKVYNNLLESVLDHGVFISANPRYAEAMKNRHDPKTFIRLVHKAGYATDPAYTDKIVNLMDRYNLYVFDRI